MIVDAHHHLWDPSSRDYPWLADASLAPIRRAYSVDDLRAHAAAAGVTTTVLVQTVSDVGETREFLATAAASGGLVGGVVGWVDLTDPAVADTIAGLRSGPGGQLLVGIRHQAQDEADPGWLVRPDVLRGLAAVADADLAYDLLVLPHQLPAATASADRVPAGRFVLDHAAKPPVRSGETQPWAADLRQLAERPNVTCKLSGLVSQADWESWTTQDLRPYADVVLDAFGPQRTMAGSDWPVCELAATYDQVWAATNALLAGMSDSERTAVLSRTAGTIYRLEQAQKRSAADR